MNYSRVMGNNVELEFKRHNWNVEESAEKVGLSVVDAHKLLQNFRSFDNPDNQDKSLDMIDMYADWEEVYKEGRNGKISFCLFWEGWKCTII